jgi:hypothetical protein
VIGDYWRNAEKGDAGENLKTTELFIIMRY